MLSVLQVVICMCFLSSLKANRQRLAYHILHPEETLPMLPRILSELQQYPVVAHLYIHTFQDLNIALPNVMESQKLFIIRHDPISAISMQNLDSTSRINELSVLPSVRSEIVQIGKKYEYSMYAEDGILVTANSFDLWLTSHSRAFAKNLTVAFVRVECTLAVCRAVDYNSKFAGRMKLVTLSKGHMFMHQNDTVVSGVWALPSHKLMLLDQHHPTFLRHNHSSGRAKRDGLALGGADAFAGSLFAVKPSRPNVVINPHVAVLQHGARRWHGGYWWCGLIDKMNKCELFPEYFYSAVPAVTPVSPQVSNVSTAGAINSKAVQVRPAVQQYISRMTEQLKPLSKQICNVHSIRFNVSRIHHISDPGISLHSDVSKDFNIGYGPWLTKAGSSSVRVMLRELTEPKFKKNDKFNVSFAAAILNENQLADFTFISFIRNPVDRALAGYHQMEAFFHMGWLDREIRIYNLKWWNLYCVDPTFGIAKRQYKCAGSLPNNNMTTVLKRLNTYLEEIDRIGFYDQHQTPMSYLIASNPVSASPRTYFYDMKDMFKVGEVLSTMTGLKISGHVRLAREKVKKEFMPWSIKWSELASLSIKNNNDTTLDGLEVASLASKAISLICELYKSDIKCLPYEIPECL